MKPIIFLQLILVAYTMTACALQPTITPTSVSRISSPTNTATKTPTPAYIKAVTPAWWDSYIAMPSTAEFIGDSNRAIWKIRDTNIEGIKDFLLQAATTAGYQYYIITESPYAIYTLLLVKEHNAIALNVTLGSDATFISGSTVGVLRLKVSGAKNIELVLPMRTRLDMSAGSEISIGTSIPSLECAQCEYFINVHIAPFKGPGRYDSKPGLYIIDVQVIPGGNPDMDDYRWASSCVVLVQDPLSGSFDCKGLANINDYSKHIDVSGNWVQPK